MYEFLESLELAKFDDIAGWLTKIRLVTWGATNKDMLLYRKSRLWGCYKSRHVTK